MSLTPNPTFDPKTGEDLPPHVRYDGWFHTCGDCGNDDAVFIVTLDGEDHFSCRSCVYAHYLAIA
jgi:hypothetical protein